ncbi:methyltransferase domain-containing protein [Acidocella aromatica]|uniref:2-polyprenyl-3-methyl-5-hydroxy-6-metoxy-1, 4-benzoquinol methylase/glycosyltransferase involved in cell wall biosynthesis n=1 Tax=Acidocella aromatica TaxID=1303579 RepID=A0A840VN25_9PROT|nr:methyltransferase domain-containing protein [Acidocella aromatica]MBB5373579.1 2-polyprenyl-3-methyl-5-hydroxy-6-metoxy-1,4-benzoquinol methylase/glycosyltransferase involved in cell wall biosynthesis [Acidocella aromatica]
MNAAHTHYPDFANPELLEKIPLSAKTILDVGCAQGALGADYLRRNPNCRVLGIDIDEDAVSHARHRISEVFCGDVEKTPMPFEVPEGIDCIVYGDVLEHLVDPWALLAEHAKYLSPEGTILVCMPNVEHWSFVARLLTGSFGYEEQGLFDQTHLRWFTPRTMAKLLADAGLQLSDLSPRPIATDQAEQFVAALAPGLQAVGVDPQEYLNRAGPLQFIWRARKSSPERLEIDATMLAPQGGVSDVRVVEPVRALRTDSSLFGQILDEANLRPALPDTPRIAVLHRPLLTGANGLARVRTLLDKGYVVISEFDDHPIFLEQRGVNRDELLTFRGVHAVQTSTRTLAEALLPENPEIAVFPNGIFELPQPRNFQNPEQMTLFFGALNRQADWAPLIGAINDVARAVGPRLRFQVMFDEAFFDALETPHKSFTPMGDYASYLNMLGEAEICFMPLSDNPFNRAKSDLKFIESSASRVAALASPVVYADSIEDGRTGLLFNDPLQLRAALLRLLAYPEATKRMAEAARAYVAGNRMLAYQVEARSLWYRSLWARRDELNAALKARVPELFA